MKVVALLMVFALTVFAQESLLSSILAELNDEKSAEMQVGYMYGPPMNTGHVKMCNTGGYQCGKGKYLFCPNNGRSQVCSTCVCIPGGSKPWRLKGWNASLIQVSMGRAVKISSWVKCDLTKLKIKEKKSSYKSLIQRNKFSFVLTFCYLFKSINVLFARRFIMTWCVNILI